MSHNFSAQANVPQMSIKSGYNTRGQSHPHTYT